MQGRRECSRGHVFFKTSYCPTCPKCEAARKPARGFMAEISAPARRALEGAGLTTPAKLAKRTAADVIALHGIGPNAMAELNKSLQEAGLTWATVKTRPSRLK